MIHKFIYHKVTKTNYKKLLHMLVLVRYKTTDFLSITTYPIDRNAFRLFCKHEHWKDKSNLRTTIEKSMTIF